MQENSAAMWHLYGVYNNLSRQGGLASINPQNFVKCSIQVKSTPRKILSYLSQVLVNAEENLFCGHVRYIEEHEFDVRIRGYKFKDFLEQAGQKRFAEFMCFKRIAFNHEQEIRFIYQDITVDSTQPSSDFHEFTLDPNFLFDEIVLDPRLADWECSKVKESLLINGITLNIRQSDLYKKRTFNIPFE